MVDMVFSDTFFQLSVFDACTYSQWRALQLAAERSVPNPVSRALLCLHAVQDESTRAVAYFHAKSRHRRTEHSGQHHSRDNCV